MSPLSLHSTTYYAYKTLSSSRSSLSHLHLPTKFTTNPKLPYCHGMTSPVLRKLSIARFYVHPRLASRVVKRVREAGDVRPVLKTRDASAYVLPPSFSPTFLRTPYKSLSLLLLLFFHSHLPTITQKQNSNNRH
jgi:hypothetical protein